MIELNAILSRAAVIPVLTIHNLARARPLAAVLAKAGLPVMEVTLRTPVALEAIAEMAAVPGAVVGAGTVLNERQLDLALAQRAQFIVSPGLTERLAATAADRRVPFLPGVATASDIMRGLDLGLEVFKFFPAEASGGLKALDALRAPFPQCRFCPTGGITFELASAYLSRPGVPCVGGSWMATAALVEAEDWRSIARLAQDGATLGSC